MTDQEMVAIERRRQLLREVERLRKALAAQQLLAESFRKLLSEASKLLESK